jgi:hypothetical protein
MDGFMTSIETENGNLASSVPTWKAVCEKP